MEGLGVGEVGRAKSPSSHGRPTRADAVSRHPSMPCSYYRRSRELEYHVYSAVGLLKYLIITLCTESASLPVPLALHIMTLHPSMCIVTGIMAPRSSRSSVVH